MGLYLRRDARLIFDDGLAKVALCPSRLALRLCGTRVAGIHCVYGQAQERGLDGCNHHGGRGGRGGGRCRRWNGVDCQVGGTWIGSSCGIGRGAGSDAAHPADEQLHGRVTWRRPTDTPRCRPRRVRSSRCADIRSAPPWPSRCSSRPRSRCRVGIDRACSRTARSRRGPRARSMWSARWPDGAPSGRWRLERSHPPERFQGRDDRASGHVRPVPVERDDGHAQASQGITPMCLYGHPARRRASRPSTNGRN